MKLQSINPSNNQILGEIEISTKKEVRDKVKLAKKAQAKWQGTELKERVKILRKVLRKIKRNGSKLAKLASQEMGMPIGDAEYDINDGLNYFKWYLDNAKRYLKPETTFQDKDGVHTVLRESYGVAAVIVPWNFPMSNFVWQCGQNLVAGNAVVFKHSEEVPLFSQKLEEVINSSELPEGVFNVVYGDGKVGDYLIHQDIDLICFTGSSRVGQYIYQVAAEKFIPIVAELGGSAAGIILPDANVDKILDSIVMVRFFNSGQVCDGLKRLIVHRYKLDEVISKIVAKVEKMKIGDAMDKDTQMGPLVAERQVKLLEEQVADAVKKGAKILTGGKGPKNLSGAYYLPTVIIKVKKNMRIWKEEVFGPVLPIVSFEETEEAIRLANDTKYGLGGYVFTEDKELFGQIASKIRTGMVQHNNVSYLKPSNPFGGYKKSGMGREHGKYGFEDVTQVKVVAREK